VVSRPPDEGSHWGGPAESAVLNSPLAGRSVAVSVLHSDGRWPPAERSVADDFRRGASSRQDWHFHRAGRYVPWPLHAGSLADARHRPLRIWLQQHEL